MLKFYRIIYEARIVLSNCDDLLQLPTTSHLDACQFVADDHNAQLCFRLVQWLEGLASKALDLENKVMGCIFLIIGLYTVSCYKLGLI